MAPVMKGSSLLAPFVKVSFLLALVVKGSFLLEFVIKGSFLLVLYAIYEIFLLVVVLYMYMELPIDAVLETCINIPCEAEKKTYKWAYSYPEIFLSSYS